MIKLVDARKNLHEKCVELFHDKEVAKSIYMYLCDGIEECDAIEPERKKGEWTKTMTNNIKPNPIAPLIPMTEQQMRDSELWDAIGTAIHMCGYNGDDVTRMGIEVLKQIGRVDLIPPCER